MIDHIVMQGGECLVDGKPSAYHGFIVLLDNTFVPGCIEACVSKGTVKCYRQNDELWEGGVFAQDENGQPILDERDGLVWIIKVCNHDVDLS